MAKIPIELYCWDKSHQTLVEIPKGQKDKFLRMVRNGKRVCPSCKPENKLMTCTDDFSGLISSKAYKCKHGHLSTISMFASGGIHVRYGEDSNEFENFQGGLDAVDKHLDSKEISCNHVVEGRSSIRVCGCKLKECDDKVLELPSGASFGIKTKNRLGDWWDKQGIIHQREEGSVVDGGGFSADYKPSNYESAHAERLKNMPRKRVTKKTDVERLKRSTNNSYEQSGDRSKARSKAPRQSYDE